jgi:hypothetical protein
MIYSIGDTVRFPTIKKIVRLNVIDGIPFYGIDFYLIKEMEGKIVIIDSVLKSNIRAISEHIDYKIIGGHGFSYPSEWFCNNGLQLEFDF